MGFSEAVARNIAERADFRASIRTGRYDASPSRVTLRAWWRPHLNEPCIALLALFFLLLIMGTSGAYGGVEGEEEVSHICGDSAEVLRPIHFTPSLNVNRFKAQFHSGALNNFPPGLTFKLKGDEPCQENGCNLEIFEGTKQRQIAILNIGEHNVKYCQNIYYISNGESTKETKTCGKKYYIYANTIHFDVGEKDIKNVSIHIAYYFMLEEKSKRQARYCIDGGIPNILGSINNMRWAFFGSDGSATFIEETEMGIKPSGLFDPSDLIVTPIGADAFNTF
jgi:hypothetical protein